MAKGRAASHREKQPAARRRVVVGTGATIAADVLAEVERGQLDQLRQTMSPPEFANLLAHLNDSRRRQPVKPTRPADAAARAPVARRSDPVERVLDDVARRGSLPDDRRSVAEVRWWWRHYAAPRYRVVEETIDGKTRVLGELPVVVKSGDGCVLINVGGIVKTDDRRRRSPDDVARLVRWYYNPATQEAIAEKSDTATKTVQRGLSWLCKQLEQLDKLPKVPVTDKAPS
jgi:hypothetical protein